MEKCLLQHRFLLLTCVIWLKHKLGNIVSKDGYLPHILSVYEFHRFTT